MQLHRRHAMAVASYFISSQTAFIEVLHPQLSDANENIAWF